MGNFLYLIIIYPIYMIIELVYSFCYVLTDNLGLSIVGVSFAVSLLCLPLYILAEKWQEIERNTVKALKPGVDRIKAVFSGDEQYMILSTYYKQNHYHPAMALRSSLSLLIQIPFFIAAYKFISNLEFLKGCSFLFINDLSSPDAIITIGNFNINILPIAMTLINIISGIVYSKGHPLKEKMQIYIVAAFFLFFLYNSPSGLVLYWTLNNIISLVKNIFYKLKNPKKVLFILLTVTIIFADIYLLFFHPGKFIKRLLLSLIATSILLIPFIFKLCNKIINKYLQGSINDIKSNTIIFITSCLSITLLIGIVIPSIVITSSPGDFSFVDNYTSPYIFIKDTLFKAIGLFIFWPCSLYFLFNKKTKMVFSFSAAFLLIFSFINTFIFNENYGTLSKDFIFSKEGALIPSVFTIISNILVFSILLITIYWVFKNNKTKVFSYISIISILACFVIYGYNSINISKEYKIMAKEIKINELDNNDTNITPLFNLSKTEKNIIVLMEDYAIGSLMPYLLEERPDLYDTYEGFTYYKNTVSFGPNTLLGSPELYGGYEYTPYLMNEDKNRPLVEKHNEALRVMPVLFDSNNFETTSGPLSWANYYSFNSKSLFEDYPNINQINFSKNITNKWLSEHPEINLNKESTNSLFMKRNFILFGIFKTLSPILRPLLYYEGTWWNIYKSTTNLHDFISTYSVLDYLPELTRLESKHKTFSIFVNVLTHLPCLTGYPNYDLTTSAIGPSLVANCPRYNSFASAFLRIGDFLNYLKENDVYDNTRIIIVADHGGSSQLENINPELKTYYPFNPILLVKDFDSKGKLNINNEFMTNADVPYLATKDIINNPINVFTGKTFEETIKKDKVYCMDGDWNPPNHKENEFIPYKWYSVHDDMSNPSNWKEESPYNK